MDGRQLRPKLAQHSHRCRLVVHEYAALAAGGNLTAHNQRAVFRFVQPILLEHLLDRVPGAAFALEDRRHYCPFRSGANHVTRRLFTQQQRQRIDQNGFPRARFSGQQVQPGGELHRRVVDDRVVLQTQFNQHRAVLG